MLDFIVIARHASCHVDIFLVMVFCGVAEFVTVFVVPHEGFDIGGIMAHVDGGRVLVVRRQAVPVPRGNPWLVVALEKMLDDERPSVEDRLDDVGLAVDVRSSDYLHIVFVEAGDLDDKGGHVLEDIHAKDILDHEDMRPSSDRLHNTEIVDIAVEVEVQVGEHVGRVVKQHLEFLNR